MTNYRLDDSSAGCWPKKKLAVFIFFFIYISIGMVLFQDYGISWDEPTERKTGIVSAIYIVEYFDLDILKGKIQEAEKIPLEIYEDNVYGVAFQLPVLLLEQLLGITDSRDIYLFRHIMTFLVSIAGIFAVFKLAERRFSDWRIGLTGAIFLILSPRLFAHSFFNVKDSVFMACFAVSVDSTVQYLLNPTKKKAAWHALITAFLIDLRVVGLLIPAVTIIIALIRVFKKEVSSSKVLPSILIYSILTVFLTITFWPYLWADPLANFIKAFEKMAHYPFDGYVRYFGSMVHSSNLPWHYIPVWIAITTPLLYLFYFFIGSGVVFMKFLSSGIGVWRNDEELQDVLFLSLCIFPIIIVISLGSVLYDGWRQMFFIYPMFILVVLRGFMALLKRAHSLSPKFFTPCVTIGTSVCLIFIAKWMIQAHPYQNVYFNKLVGHNVKTKFEVDYWGLGTMQILQHIADNDKQESITVWNGSGVPLWEGKLMIKKEDRRRISLTSTEEKANYIITNYRYNLINYGPKGRGYKNYYDIYVDGEAVMSAFVK